MAARPGFQVTGAVLVLFEEALKADSRSAQAKHSHHAESRLGGEM
jgi:hypothetical protein